MLFPKIKILKFCNSNKQAKHFIVTEQRFLFFYNFDFGRLFNQLNQIGQLIDGISFNSKLFDFIAPRTNVHMQLQSDFIIIGHSSCGSASLLNRSSTQILQPS